VSVPQVRLQGVDKVFMAGEPPAPLHACGPIDLELRRGEFFAVVGPSGCGKSTLLELIAGLTSPTNGAIEFPFETSAVRAALRSPTLKSPVTTTGSAGNARASMR